MSGRSDSYDEWYVEFVAGEIKYNRRTAPYMIQLKDLAEERVKHSGEECYSSLFRYPTSDPYNPPLLAGFIVDLNDRQSGGEKARKEAIFLINEMVNRYHINEEAVGVCFSGGKGFHIVFSRHIFDIQPSDVLHQVFKSMALELKEQLRLETLDEKLYDCRRLLRLPNSKHSSGYFKIHLTRSELENLSMDQIKQLAVKPRTTVAIKPQFSPEAEAWYKRHLNKVLEEMKEKKERFTSSEIVGLSTDPPCVKELFQKGVVEGRRNVSRYMLTVYFKTAGKSLEECKRLILDFNQRCIPLERESEVIEQVEYLYGREYYVGCAAFEDYCSGRDQCPFFTKITAVKEYPEDTKTEALQQLKSPALEKSTLSIYDKNIVREYENKLLLHYLELSGRRKNPKEKQIILLTGDPGGGKTQLANETTRFHATKKRGRLSERALDYTDLSNYHILYLQEIIGVEKEEEGISTLRFLSAEDKGYTVEVTVRDPKTGRFTTEEHVIPPICVVSTLSGVSVEAQLERRSWILNVDQSEEQTRLVFEHKARKHKERFEEILELSKPDRDLEVLACIIDMLEDGEIVVPFPLSLAKALDASLLRSRGDYDKIMSLIKLRAWYHQKQRQYFTSPSGVKIWIATPEDGVASLKLASKAMRRWRTQLDARLEEALPHIKELMREPIPIGKDESEVVYGVTASKLAKKMRKSQHTSWVYLKELTNRGVLTYTQPKGKLKVYEFAVPEEEIEKKLETSWLGDKQNVLGLEFEKEASSFLKDYLTNLNLKVEGSTTCVSEPPTADVKSTNTLKTGVSQPILLCRNHVFQLGWYEKQREGKAEIRGLTRKETETLRCSICGDTAEFEVIPV